MNESIKYWVWLQRCFGVENLDVKKILSVYGDAEEIYRADEKELRMFDFLTEKELSRLIDKDWEYSDNTINECIKNDIDIIPLCSDSYPGRLKEIAAPPVVLFKKGILPDEKAFHANIVGTRYPDTSGRQAAYNFAYDLAKENTVIVSGGAIGVDTAAHEGAIDGEGLTLCVLGFGIDQLRDKKDSLLLEKIPQNGALLSEYPPDYPPTKYTFPKRNRIIAGLSDCSLVIQAGFGSGAMYTVKYSLAQNKKIFAVPSALGTKNGAGTNYMISFGFSAALCPDDIINWYNNKKRSGSSNPVPTVDFYRNISEKKELPPPRDNSRKYPMPLCYSLCREISESSYQTFFDLNDESYEGFYRMKDNVFGREKNASETEYTDHQRAIDEKRLDELIKRAINGEPEPMTEELKRKLSCSSDSIENIRAGEIIYLKKKLNKDQGIVEITDEELMSLFNTEDEKPSDENDPILNIRGRKRYQKRLTQYPFRLNPYYDEETETVLPHPDEDEVQSEEYPAFDEDDDLDDYEEEFIPFKPPVRPVEIPADDNEDDINVTEIPEPENQSFKEKKNEKSNDNNEKERQNLQNVKKINEISSERLTSAAFSVYDTISDTPIHVNEIKERLGMSMPQLLSALSELQMNGYITALPGRRYKRN